jgi:hypothetical protein
MNGNGKGQVRVGLLLSLPVRDAANMKPSKPRYAIDVTSDLGRSVRIFLDGPCICGSVKRFQDCCYKDGVVAGRSAPSPTSPPPPSTNYSNPRCYAYPLNDCDAKLSKEHYLTRGVLRLLAKGGPTNTVRATGLGIPADEFPPDQVAQSKILCRRHNSALSALDVVGERFFQAINAGLRARPHVAYHSAPGVDVERWLLKVGCGVQAAAKKELPLEWLRMLFGQAEITPPCGLYMHVPVDGTVRETKGVQVGGYMRAGVPSGTDVALHGIRLTLDLVGDGGTHREVDVGSLKIYRPSGLWFDHKGKTTFHLAFEWGKQLAATQSVVLNVLEGALGN